MARSIPYRSPSDEPSERVKRSAHPLDIDYVRTSIPCQFGCPARTSIPEYIEAAFVGDHGASYSINQTANVLPGCLGRICSRPCEDVCRHGESDLGEPVAICALKRAAADLRPRDYGIMEHRFAPTGRSVAVVGGGPAGLSAARSLLAFGHQVTLFEAQKKLGGMLRYAIPRFRLPAEVIDGETDEITHGGLNVTLGIRLGDDVSAAMLLEEHDAVVLALGCSEANRVRVPGEDLPGVHSGLDFMMRVNSGAAPTVGERALILGGGFTAMDCARMAKRLGASEVSICTLATEQDLIVTKEEILETKREGVRIEGLTRSTAILGTDRVEAVQFAHTRLRGMHPDGTRKTEMIEGSEFTRPADTVIVAIGQRPASHLSGSGLESEPKFSPRTGASDVPGLFAAGDFAGGASTVISAVGHGHDVATEVDAFLMGRRRRRKVVTIAPAEDTHRQRGWDFIDRTHMPMVAPRGRFADPDLEVETGYTQDLSHEESQRCYLCHLKYEVNIAACIYCRWCIDVCPRDCIYLVTEAPSDDGKIRGPIKKTTDWSQAVAVVIDSDRCIRCGECLRICPTRCIHVERVNLVDEMIPQGAMADGE